MLDDFAPSIENCRTSSSAGHAEAAPQAEAARPPLANAPASRELPPEPPPVQRALHPLDRRAEDDERLHAAEAARIRMAWTKLVWLLSLLAVLLAVSYMVPFIAEQTQYAITRGKQRAEHDFASQHMGESPLADMSRAYQMVSQVVGPSVVHINTQGQATFGTIRRLSNSRVPTEGQGSGIIIEGSGYILTNNHVVLHSKEIEVSLADGRKLKAMVVGSDAANDLAVLKIKAEKLVPARWGDSEQVEPGALVWAVGSPFGLERTITSGILSAKHRVGLSGSLHQDFLQTDAAVNPGNSGGPLVDSQGRVIGINTAIVGDAYQGISFAIPSKVAREVYERIKTEGNVGGWLGVALAEVTDEVAQRAGLTKPAGVYVASLFEQEGGSPAARAGIKAGDVILKWNDSTVNMPIDLMRLVGKTASGSKVKVILFRNGKEITIEVTVGERPDNA